MLGGWKVEGVSELSDLILQSAQAPGILKVSARGSGATLKMSRSHHVKLAAAACVHGMSPWNVHVPDNATAWMLRLGFPRNGIHVGDCK